MLEDRGARLLVACRGWLMMLRQHHSWVPDCASAQAQQMLSMAEALRQWDAIGQLLPRYPTGGQRCSACRRRTRISPLLPRHPQAAFHDPWPGVLLQLSPALTRMAMRSFEDVGPHPGTARTTRTGARS